MSLYRPGSGLRDSSCFEILYTVSLKSGTNGWGCWPNVHPAVYRARSAQPRRATGLAQGLGVSLRTFGRLRGVSNIGSGTDPRYVVFISQKCRFPITYDA